MTICLGSISELECDELIVEVFDTKKCTRKTETTRFYLQEPKKTSKVTAHLFSCCLWLKHIPAHPLHRMPSKVNAYKYGIIYSKKLRNLHIFKLRTMVFSFDVQYFAYKSSNAHIFTKCLSILRFD